MERKRGRDRGEGRRKNLIFFFSLISQEYKARKKQKLKKKLSEQLRAHNKAEKSSGPLGLGSDLSQILSSFLERSGTQHGKGSRFQHAEKLQFAKVSYCFNSESILVRIKFASL